MALLGDSITTDHISPAGRIKLDSLTSKYLKKNKVKTYDFNTYGARRGNHEVMIRGIFSNMKIPSVYELSKKHKKMKVPSIIIAGKEYGTGSSRDWAAKGVSLLGVKAVVFKTIERIHRTNLIGMGVLPLQFLGKDNAKSLKITGAETFDFIDLESDLIPNKIIRCFITYKNKQKNLANAYGKLKRFVVSANKLKEIDFVFPRDGRKQTAFDLLRAKEFSVNDLKKIYPEISTMDKNLLNQIKIDQHR